MFLSLRSIANGLTVARAVAGFPLILALQFGWQGWAWWLLLLAGLSDAADGWLASIPPVYHSSFIRVRNCRF